MLSHEPCHAHTLPSRDVSDVSYTNTFECFLFTFLFHALAFPRSAGGKSGTPVPVALWSPGHLSAQWKLNISLALVSLFHSYPLIIYEDCVNSTTRDI